MRWFDNRPLFGKRIIITRSRTQASRLANALEERSACCIEIPTISIEAPSDDYAGMDDGIEHLDEYNWLIFTSQNGVNYFFKYVSCSQEILSKTFFKRKSELFLNISYRAW